MKREEGNREFSLSLSLSLGFNQGLDRYESAERERERGENLRSTCPVLEPSLLLIIELYAYAVPGKPRENVM